MASCRNFTLEFFGKTAHAALSHTGNDALAAATLAYGEIQTMLTRKIDPQKPKVCHVGTLNSGTAQNVVADYAKLTGTIRAYETELDAKIYSEIGKIAEMSAARFGCTCKVVSSVFLPPVINDDLVTKKLKIAAERVVGADRVVEIPQKMSSEDFADYLVKIPGVFFRIGTANPNSETQTSAHNNDFVIDESALSHGADTFVQFVLDNQGEI
jgi:amidohydrolase